MKSTYSFIIILISLNIFHIYATEYQISFIGSGAAVTIDSIQVTNLRSGQHITLTNNQSLLLRSDESGFPSLPETNNNLLIHPNPCYGKATMSFQNAKKGTCLASVYNIDGRLLNAYVFQAETGTHQLELNLPQGIFFVKISGNGLLLRSKIISTNTGNIVSELKYVGFEAREKAKEQVQAQAQEQDMFFLSGDRFLYKVYSGHFCTILPHKPVASEDINIDFYACTDASGNHYPVLILGNQVWMAENLKTTHFRNNDIISSINTNVGWKSNLLPAWCSYNNLDNAQTGLLYNWQAVNDNRIIAPEGWHVPTNDAWSELNNFLTNNQLTFDENSGFINLKSGYRNDTGVFEQSGNMSVFWTANSTDGSNSYSRNINAGNNLLSAEKKLHSNGFSVRCIRPVYTATQASFKTFDINRLPEIMLEVSPDEWNKILTYYDMNPHNEEKVLVSFTFKDDGLITVLKQTGLKLRGNTSRRRPEGSKNILHSSSNPDWHHASFSVDMNEFVSGQKFAGLKKLNLKWFKDDSMYAREVYCYDLFKRFGVWTAPESSYCKFYIYITGDPKPAYFGIYEMLESIDSDYLKKRKNQFGDDNGFLWKAFWGADFKTADASKMGIELVTLTSTYKPVYDLKNRELELQTAKTQLLQFITDLNQKTGTDFETWIESKTDVPLFLKTYAVNVMCGMWDDYWANKNNFYFYFNSSGKFFFIPYDYDNTLGTSYIMSNSGTQNLLKWGNSSHPLIEKIIAIPKYKSMYINYLHELCNPQSDLFYVSKSKVRILNWHNLIRAYISNETGEDMEIVDRPASWGNCSFYRLMEDQNNYFQIRANNLPAKIN